MKAYDGLYVIRVRLLDEEYDFYPRIKGVKFNIFEITQSDLKCENFILRKRDILDGINIIVQSHVSIYGKHLVYVKKSGGWVEIEKFHFERDVDAGRIHITVNNLPELIKDYKKDDEVMMIISYDKTMEDKMILGSGTGTSLQSIDFNEKNVLYNSLHLMISEKKNGEDVYSIWRRVDDFYSSGKYDKHFVFDEKAEKIFLGTTN